MTKLSFAIHWFCKIHKRSPAGGSTVSHLTVNLDGYVFQNFFVSPPLFGLVSLNSATDAFSIKKSYNVFPKTAKFKEK